MEADGQNDDMFLARFNVQGDHEWSKDFGNAGSQYVGRLALGADGGILLAGLFDGVVDFEGMGCPLGSNGGLDAFVAKLDAVGNGVWCESFGDALSQRATGMSVDDQGNVAIVGRVEGTTDFGGGALAVAG